MSNKITKDAVVEVALKSLLEYAKYLEDNGQLKYEFLRARVESALEEDK